MSEPDTMSEQPQLSRLPGPAPSFVRGLGCAIGLLVIVVAAHGVSLWDGLFFDDHWHRAAFRNYGWSPSDLVESATIDLSGNLNHLWWQEAPAVWRYPRPVAMGLAKAEFVLSGGNPLIIHACALGWHWLIALLVYWFALKAGLDRLWAFCAGVMFIILPHSFFSLGWTAARNAVVGAFFFAAATAAYMSASLGRPSRWTIVRCIREALPLTLWILAILSRETAIVFAFVILLIDLGYGGRRHVLKRIPYHAAFWILTLAFVAWRITSFDVGHVPEIYFTKLSSMNPLWATSKMLQLLFSQVFYTPMLMGLATYQGAPQDQWVVHAIMAGLLGLVAIWYIAVSKGVKGRWVWPLWVVAAFAPVLPVFAMPHFSYLASVPYAIMAAILLRGVANRWRRTVSILVIGATVWSLCVYRAAWWGIIRSEQIVYEDVQDSTPVRPPPGSKMFFINLPIAAIYARNAMQETWNVRDLEAYTLTFAPQPLMMTDPSIVEQINDHELMVSTDAPGYFSGMSGRMLIDGMRAGSPLTTGMQIPHKPDFPFDVTVVEADQRGVRRLRFSFLRPLDSKEYYFYVSSPTRAAFRLQFDPRPVHDPADAELFKRARSSNLIDREAALGTIYGTARPVAIAMASPILSDLALQSESSLARVEKWWMTFNVGRLGREMTDWRSKHAMTLWQRDLYFKVMGIVEEFVQSDLYLTGRR
jgi:hypothetical protein